MRRIDGYKLWLGNVGDILDLSTVLDVGVEAVVDLALNEPIPPLTRELVYFRCPLIDGAGNDPRTLRLAVITVGTLLNDHVSTLVYCSAGMSRTPAVAAVAIALTSDLSVKEALTLVTRDSPSDISSALLSELCLILD